MSLYDLLIVSGSGEGTGSLLVRSDNLATLQTIDGLQTVPSRYNSAPMRENVYGITFLRSKKLIRRPLRDSEGREERTVPPNASCIAAGGGYIAIGCDDGTIKLHREQKFVCISQQQLHIGPITCMFIDTSLWVLVAGSATGNIGVWCIPDLYNESVAFRTWVHIL